MRYVAVEGSHSGHCCFEATVADTLTSCEYGVDGRYDTICECFNMDSALRIADALNLLAEQESKPDA